MFFTASAALAAVWWTTIGLFVGSFLNVAIYRLPVEGETVSRPRRSRCPKCKTTLGWKENLPVLSWLVQRGRCWHCAARVSARYPMVEILTAGLWYLAAISAPPAEWPLILVRVLVLSGLVVATFVDFDHFEIPDEVSIGGAIIAPMCALLVPSLHSGTYVAQVFSAEGHVGVDRFGSLAGCVVGMAVGWGILWGIGWIGTKIYGTEAMGFGDVKLMAAGGGFIGPGGVVYALMIAAFVASIVGVANMVRFYILIRGRARARGGHRSPRRALAVARIAGRYLPFGPYLALGIGIVLLYWNHVRVALL
ncbi:MAG: prepilin peptidase [bacterium]|nr:prepilin peptidase [bacterium]